MCYTTCEPESVCPRCGSEDTFPMNDGGWPCSECKQPKLNFAEAQKPGALCASCRGESDSDPV